MCHLCSRTAEASVAKAESGGVQGEVRGSKRPALCRGLTNTVRTWALTPGDNGGHLKGSELKSGKW